MKSYSPDKLASYLDESAAYLQYLFRLDIPRVTEPQNIDGGAHEVFDRCFSFFEDYLFQFDDSCIKKDNILLLNSERAYDYWEIILKDHAILSFYVLLRSIACINSAVDPTTARERMYKDLSDSLTGLEYLKENKSIYFSEYSFSYSPTDEQERSEELKKLLRSKSSALLKQLIEIDKKLDAQAYHHFPLTAEKKVLLGNLEYAGALCKRSRALGLLSKFYMLDGKPTVADQENYQQVYKDILETLDSPFLKKADRLYAKVQIERELHVRLSNCLYQNMKNIETKYNRDYFSSRETIDALSFCTYLPNVLSRNLIVSSAFGMLDDLLSNRDRSDDPFFEWIISFKNLMYHLANFFFPLYESLFMVSLYQGIKATIAPSENGSWESKCYNKIVLAEVLSVTSNYLNSHDVFDALSEKNDRALSEEMINNLCLFDVTKPDLNTGVERFDLEKYHQCFSCLTREPVFEAPLVKEDIDCLFPSKRLWNRSICQLLFKSL